MQKNTLVLGFSGGLDTSFFVPYLKEQYKKKHDIELKIITVAINTGGFSNDELKQIEKRSTEIGADKHYSIDGRRKFFDEIIQYVIKANALRWDKYPLCVAAERKTQVELLIEIAKKEKADSIGHGCTGAGNDQYRFDGYIQTLYPEANIVAPTRDNNFSREEEIQFLEKKGIHVNSKKAVYSYNIGLLGISIGGKETNTTWEELPESAYIKTKPIEDAPEKPQVITIHFERGIPIGIDDKELDPLECWEAIDKLAAIHGVGRGIYVGDTTTNSKGRIGYEAPAATTLIFAHKALEELTFSKAQYELSKVLSGMYSDLIYHARYYDSARGNIEATLDDMQKVVCGKVRLKLQKGNISVLGVSSPYSLLNNELQYGENNSIISGEGAKGSCVIHAVPNTTCYKRDQLLI